jgi:hypothetical protein
MGKPLSNFIISMMAPREKLRIFMAQGQSTTGNEAVKTIYSLSI